MATLANELCMQNPSEYGLWFIIIVLTPCETGLDLSESSASLGPNNRSWISLKAFERLTNNDAFKAEDLLRLVASRLAEMMSKFTACAQM